MSKYASKNALLLGGVALFAAAVFVAACAQDAAAQDAAPQSAEPPENIAPPDFSSHRLGWEGANGLEFLAVPGSPPAVTFDPANPYINNAISRVTGQQQTYHISDLTNPNLMQWAKDIMRLDNDEVLGGKIAYMPGQSCKAWGTPAVLQSGGPFFIEQTPSEVLIVEEDDGFVRHVYLNVPHSENPKPSWYGESVGHYEGDTLVIDTIGMNTETYVDFFRTPHTEKMHVVERWQLADDGNQLEILITVDDPGTYYAPWQVMRHLEHGEIEFGEHICREGNFKLFDYGIPIEETPDF